jgi:hypothetical protein
MIMNKRLRRDAARACPVHKAVYDEAVRRLIAHDQFSFNEVLEATRLTAMAEAIRWDYIREFILEDHDLRDLIPLSQAYYERHKRESELANPGKYVAWGGANREAVGYASATEDNRHLVVARLQQRRSVLNGSIKRFQGCVDEARNKLGHDVLDLQIASVA